jgi:hypothetical protein
MGWPSNQSCRIALASEADIWIGGDSGVDGGSVLGGSGLLGGSVLGGSVLGGSLSVWIGGLTGDDSPPVSVTSTPGGSALLSPAPDPLPPQADSETRSASMVITENMR